MTIVRVGAMATIAFVCIAGTINHLIPSQTNAWRIWWNVSGIAELPRMVIFGLMMSVPWYVGAVVAFPVAEPFFKRPAFFF